MITHSQARALKAGMKLYHTDKTHDGKGGTRLTATVLEEATVHPEFFWEWKLVALAHFEHDEPFTLSWLIANEWVIGPTPESQAPLTFPQRRKLKILRGMKKEAEMENGEDNHAHHL